MRLVKAALLSLVLASSCSESQGAMLRKQDALESTAPAIATTPYTSRGCYANQPATRTPGQNPDFRAKLMEKVGIKPEECMANCRDYIYFGLINSNMCACSHAYNSYGESTACSNGVGGRQAVDVYLINPYYSVGCFNNMPEKNTPGSRPEFRNKMIEKVGIDAHDCMVNCKDYTYFALINANTCACANAYGSYGASTACRNGVGAKNVADVYQINK